MKKIILAITLLVAFQITAQERPQGMQKGKKGQLAELSNEQLADLKTKKMVLQLDLTDDQIKPIYDINLEMIKERRAKKEAPKKDRSQLTADEKYELMNARLDKQIAMKERLSKILTPEQMEKLKKSKAMAKKKKMKLKKQYKKQ